jgi:hypothetical protein
MKYTLILAALCSGTAAFAQHGHPDEAQSRAQWEVQRLADPATGQIPAYMRQKELAFAATLPQAVPGNRQVSFTSRGPWNVGGRTRGFAMDVSNPSRLLAGGVSGGMWISNDGGSTWTMTTQPDALKNVTCLAQDTRTGFTQNWYYGSGEAYGASASGGNAYFLGDGVFKSTDGGLSWTQLAATSSGNPNNFSTSWQLVWNIVTDPSAVAPDEVVYAATYGGVYRTTDGGTTWASVRGGQSYFTDVAVTSTGVVYATLSSDGTQKGIWRSTDGTTFTNITPASWPATYDRIVIGINPSNENEVYFLAHTPGAGKATYDWQGTAEYNSFYRYTYLTGDGAGANGQWDDLSLNLPNPPGQFEKWQVQGSYDMVVKVHPTQSNVVFIGGTNLYRSTTAFNDSLNTTFIGGYLPGSALPVIASYQDHHPDQHVIFFDPADADVLYNANDGGVFRTQDNLAGTVVWEPLNNGYLTTQFYTVAIDHGTAGSNEITAGAQDNGTWWVNSASPTQPWLHPRGGDGSYCAIADGRTSHYFSIQNGKMQKANVDAAGTVLNYARIDPIGGERYQFINPFTLDPNNNNIMYLAGGKYLWRNHDLSGIPMVNNWDSISTNWTQWPDSIPQANVTMTAVHACHTPANRVYYGGSRRNIFRVDNAHTGTPTPVDISNTLMPATGNTSCIESDPQDGDKLLVSFSNYNVYSLFYSIDGGTTWDKVAGNLEQNATGTGNGPSIRWMQILHVSDGTVYLCATSIGLFATDTLQGINTQWVQLAPTEIGNAVVDMIDVRDSDGLVVVATHASGIYSTTITSVQDIMNGVNEWSHQQALQVFPNPAEDILTVQTPDVVEEGELLVTDELGRVVLKQVCSGQTHRVDVSRLPAGLYYAVVRTQQGRVAAPFIRR